MHTVTWLDLNREPQVAPNPDFPKGKDIVLAHPGRARCKVELPYPAKRCGIYMVRCFTCGLVVGVTTAGRPDDPRSVTLECKSQSGAEHDAFLHSFAKGTA